ncbi:MAG: type I DNA topoisomerase [Anaerolineae bacterium]|nr:type I DNA topoisomerase [Anaerolineae bacterium]
MTTTENIEAYCVKCKTKRVVQNPTPVFTKKGQPAVQGLCPECGTRMFRMGKTRLHEGMKPPPKPAQPKPTGKLVIVESPAKARTVGRFLGKGYTVKASVGHVRDLLRSQLSVDVDNDFEPKYRIPNDKRPIVKELAKQAGKAAQVYLATDLDREGEAIAWHLFEALDLQDEQVQRVVFHEITEEAIEEAFAHPRGINMDLVNAQQARRILDRLVGYKLSPLLWRKVRGRLSAGRVQSVALRLVVERQREIDAFVPEEYWTLDAELAPQTLRTAKKRQIFKARLVKINEQDVAFKTQGDVTPILSDLEKAEYEVVKVKKGKRTRKSPAPYTTSTMTQEASRKRKFSARKTMRIAQQLYEGIDLGDGQPIGLITYMRTDSTNISQQAQAQARTFIAQTYGPELLPSKPPVYKTRAKSAQEAHEAIRPTSAFRTPAQMKTYLSRDQQRLYDLIWRRFIASQMRPAVYDTIAVEIAAGDEQAKPYLFRATGSVLRFQGFLTVYEEKTTDNGDQAPEQRIPALKVHDYLDLIQLLPEQHFTQPPPAYTDASLIKTLEEYGIGRPSTYAAILATIQQRGYVSRQKRKYAPTDTGYVVNDLLVEHFPDIINVDFSAHMETELDEVASGDMNWITLMHEFYGPFAKAVEIADQAMPKIEQIEYIGRECPDCEDGQLLFRWGRYGKFVGCSNFPKCRYTEPWLEKIGVKCPDCDDGQVVAKRTKRGRVFYGCSTWPKCEYVSWKRPLPTPCPSCGSLLVVENQKEARCTSCEQTFNLEDVEAVAEEVTAP